MRQRMRVSVCILPLPEWMQRHLNLIWFHREEGDPHQKPFPEYKGLGGLLTFPLCQGRRPWVKFKTLGP